LMHQHKVPLYSYIFSMVKDEGTASDIFQEVFIKVFKNMASYKEQGKFKSWMFKIASNLVMDYFRKNKPMQLDEYINLEDKTDKNPVDVLAKEEDVQIIKNAMDKLSPQDREVIYLRQYSAMSFKEISSALKLPLGTVLARASRTLKKLRVILGEQNA
ncbi:MAG TPA: RNA polymerase sigma factor, partial [Elusimicrobiales bacterium]|nr:RNA polymerase sigma factor [Elusimicrobiales bacterium]